MAQLTNENQFAKATSNIASACLEVPDATCVNDGDNEVNHLEKPLCATN